MPKKGNEFYFSCSKKCSRYHVVISIATMKSSLRMRAVNEIDTICRNSFSKSTRDMIMIVAPSRLQGKDEMAL